jgi:hypothetical protein
MFHKSALASACVLLASTALLSACGSESKDEVLGGIITECQLNAHGLLEGLDLTDEKKHFALGEHVEQCLRKSGLQPSNLTQADGSCLETPKSAEDGKGFVKPLQKCWERIKSSKN